MPLIVDYINQLASIQSPSHLNGPHADWIWARSDDVAATVAKLNKNLGFTATGSFQPHIMTTSVGDARGLLFVSANPGWSPKSNPLEDKCRRSNAAANRSFCSDFFRVYRDSVGTSRWWSRALLLAHLVKEGAPKGSTMIVPRERWAWAQGRGVASGVGNVDLIPFHSTADQFGTLAGANLDPARQALRNVATATLNMVLKLNPAPELTFVGSSLGAGLMDGLCEDLNMVLLATPKEDVDHRDWKLLHRWVHPGTGAKVMTFPRQVFAGFASFNLPPGFMVPLAARIRAFIANPIRFRT